MARNQRIVRMTLLVAVLLMSLFSIGPAQAQGQSPAYAGRSLRRTRSTGAKPSCSPAPTQSPSSRPEVR